MKKGKLSRSKLNSKLDAVYSKYIRNKYADELGMVQCVTCKIFKPVAQMQNGHYISRRYMATRWLDKNCFPQCIVCNVFNHGQMDEYALFLKETLNEGILEELNSLKHQIVKMSLSELQEKIEYYEGLNEGLNVAHRE